MRISQAGIDLVKRFETCELSAYPDPGSALGKACAALGKPMREYWAVVGWEKLDGGPWTIGWGYTGKEVHEGMEISQARADLLLASTLDEHERAVMSLVKVAVTQGQFDALVSFAYNVGDDIDGDDVAEGLGDSTLLRKLNAGDTLGAATEFLKWDKSGGVVLRGLTRRRQAERELFLEGIA